MPILPSAIKALRQSKRKERINKPMRSRYKNSLIRMRKNPSLENLRKAFSALDKAVQKKIIHQNKSSRLKSRLTKLLKKSKKKAK